MTDLVTIGVSDPANAAAFNGRPFYLNSTDSNSLWVVNGSAIYKVNLA